MRNPPRRSRPKKPGTTIDLEAAAAPAVGYPGPASAEARPAVLPSDGPTADDPESRLENDASIGDAAGALDGRGDGTAVTPLAVPASQAGRDAAAKAGEEAATEAFAAEEGLRGRTEAEFGDRADDDETILAAAEPDLGPLDDDAHSGPPAPSYDYNTTGSQQEQDPRGGRGFGSAFGAAVLGAVLALGAAGILQYAGYIPAVRANLPPEALQQYARTGDVQQVSTDLGVVRDQVAQLQSAQAAGGAGTGVTSAELTAVADRVALLEQRAPSASAAGAPAPAGDGEATAARQAADRAAQTADAAKQAADRASQAIGQSQQAADRAVQTADAAKQSADQAGQTAGQSQTLAQAAQAAATQAAGTAQAALATADGAQQAAAAAQAAATAAQAAAASAGETVAKLDPRMAALEASNRRAGIAVSAAGLKAAVDRGGPFMSELETFASVAGDSSAIGTLRNFAAAGVPSKETLAAQWPETGAAVRKALQPVDPKASVSDQLLSGLGSLVSVRPSGAPATTAEGPEATMARLDGPLKGGDLEAWLGEWQKLPQPAKDASEAFRAKVEARLATDKVVGESLAKAVASAGTPG